MADTRTALELCELVRSDTGIYDRSRLRNGFSADEGKADRAILPLLNEGLAIALGTGYAKCRLLQPTEADEREYPINYRQGSVTYVAWRGKILPTKRIGEIKSLYPDFLTQSSAPQPMYYYSDIPDKIGLFPAPNVTDVISDPPEDTDDPPSLEILAEVAQPDLVVETDTPSRLIVKFHDRCRYYASWRICVAMLGADGIDTEAFTFKATDAAAQWKSFLSDLQAWAQAPEEGTVAQVRPDLQIGGDWVSGWGGW